jgi:hypothetical protein
MPLAHGEVDDSHNRKQARAVSSPHNARTCTIVNRKQESSVALEQDQDIFFTQCKNMHNRKQECMFCQLQQDLYGKFKISSHTMQEHMGKTHFWSQWIRYVLT